MLRRTRRHTTLNKGWGVNPSDTPLCTRDHPVSSSLNKGWGVNPSDTAQAEFDQRVNQCAQQRLGCKPQRHQIEVQERSDTKSVAQQRLGCKPQRHSPSRSPATASSTTLNKGWGVNPSDTRPVPFGKPKVTIAQQRLGCKPQRHHEAQPGKYRHPLRSTKAGV